MADNTLVIQIDLEKGDTTTAFKGVEQSAKKAGKKSGEKFSDGFENGLKGILKIAAKVAAAVTGIFSAVSIKAAVEQENAINRLNTALAIAGDFSQQASQDFQELASSLQQSSRFGDEAILNQIALAKSFGATNEQAKLAATAAVDLAEAFGIDLESATRNAAKTLGGYAGELGEVIPELKELTQEQLKAGEGIALIAERFGGTAAQRINTFGGALTQLSNIFGDFTEEIGFIFTQSPVLVKTIKLLSETFTNLGSSVKEFRSGGDIFTSLANGAVSVGKVLVNFVIKPLEIIFNALTRIGTKVFGTFDSIKEKIISTFQGILDSLQPVFDFIGESISLVVDTANEKITTLNDEQGGLFAGLLDSATLTEELNAGLEGIQTFVDTAEPIVQDFKNKTKDVGKPLVEGLSETAKAANSIIKNQLGRAISGGIQNIVASIAAGKNAFASFGNFLLQVFGDLAIQLGEFFILKGLAVEALKKSPFGSAGATIAAGAALVALGALLKSASGGGGAASSAGAGGTSGGGGFGTEPDDLAGGDPEAQEFREKTNVQLVVEGSIFNTEETARNLTDLLNDNFDTTGAALTNTRLV